MPNKSDIQRWRSDPAAFIEEICRDPETSKLFILNRAERRFLTRALTLNDSGRLKYPELLFAAPKKSGKTGFAALILIYVIVVLGGSYAEGYCVANDFDQAQGRVFQAACRILEASPLLRDSAKITSNKIEFVSTGSVITAIASDYAGSAGANPTITIFDELWGYTSERSQRLWDEMVPVPTRAISLRLTVTYAGYSAESELLERLYKLGLQGEEVEPSLYEQAGLLMAWHHEPIAPWQDDAWLAQMRQQLRPNAYLRLIENKWVTSESSFVDMAWWDACLDPELTPALTEPSTSVWVGVDAGVKRDSTAVVAATFANGKVRLVWHRIFQPSPEDPLDFELTIEKTLLDLRRRFRVREVRYDPYQLVAVAQRLTAAGLPMIEFPQSVPNLTESSTNLYELVKGRNLMVYPDEEVRLAVSRAVALETSRGWRIAKEKQSHKIDVVVAMAMAALGAVQQGQASQKIEYQAAPAQRRTGAFDGGSGRDPWKNHSREDDRAELLRRANPRSRWDGY